VEDIKNIYQVIGKMAGLKRDLRSRPAPQAHPGRSDQRQPHRRAWRIVGTVSGTFYKPVTSDTIFVAQNPAPTKHKDLDDLAVQTFYLTNVSQQNDGNEIRDRTAHLLPADDKIYLIQSQNAIIMRAPQEHLVLAEKLLNDLDRTKAEVVWTWPSWRCNRTRCALASVCLSRSASPRRPTTAPRRQRRRPRAAPATLHSR